MAYCLRSFVQILQEVLYPDQHHKKWVLDHDKIPQVQSLLENGTFLRDFLDNSSPLIQDRIASLEDQIMDAAEKAEDSLETYLTSQLISYPEGQAVTISPPNLGEAIQAFDVAKQEVIKFVDACQRPDDNVSPPVSSTRYPDHNNVVVGVTEDLNQLRSRLTSHASELDIISIVGMGGMGKTTLARILYDQFSSSNSHFDCFAWVTVSQTYDPQQILRTLLSCIPEKSQQHDNNVVVSMHKTLYGRRYLIVLDDIWSRKAWDDVQRAFPRDNKGSRIILTTREKTLVDYVNSKCHEMHLINNDDSWKLLRGKVFGEESCPQELEEVGKSIAESCGGLPLALQVIGGLLSQSHKRINFWEHVAKNVRSLIAETHDQFSGIFDWSFAHLPHYLKPCFLYMAGFREDEEIPTSKIIKLWVSEGFLYPIRDKSLEEAARLHLNALINRNLVFVRGRGKRGRAKSLGIHDLLRDLCLRKAHKKKFLHFKGFQNAPLYDASFIGRIVRYDGGPLIFTPLVRSFRNYGTSDYNFLTNDLLSGWFFKKISLLRVLDLGSIIFSDEFPGVILELVNLRYLRIQSEECTPVSICVLRNLQTLIVRNISSLVMIFDMPQLRHLEFKDMEEYYSELAYGFNENLQSLSTILPAKEVRKLIGKLPNLRKLDIACDKKLIDLTCFHKLETLTYWHGLSHNMTFPVSLKKLSLKECKIDQLVLDAIGKLPNLQILVINIYFCKGKVDWEPCEGGFRSLQYLEIKWWYLENWLATDANFPVLEHLSLEGCDYLIEIPNEFGDIPTLKVIEVELCLPSVLDSARRIYEEQSQFGNTDLELRLGDVLEADEDEETYDFEEEDEETEEEEDVETDEKTEEEEDVETDEFEEEDEETEEEDDVETDVE